MSSRTLAAVPRTMGMPSCEAYWMNSARGIPENRAARPMEMLSSRYRAVASARRMPGSSRIESPSRCTKTASGRWRFSTTTGCSCAARSAAEGLRLSSLTLTAFIVCSLCRKKRRTRSSQCRAWQYDRVAPSNRLGALDFGMRSATCTCCAGSRTRRRSVHSDEPHRDQSPHRRSRSDRVSNSPSGRP